MILNSWRIGERNGKSKIPFLGTSPHLLQYEAEVISLAHRNRKLSNDRKMYFLASSA